MTEEQPRTGARQRRRGLYGPPPRLTRTSALTGRLVWLGVGGLGVLTFVAMLVGNNFWSMAGPDRFIALNTFFEHLSLIAGLVLVSIRAEETSP